MRLQSYADSANYVDGEWVTGRKGRRTVPRRDRRRRSAKRRAGASTSRRWSSTRRTVGGPALRQHDVPRARAACSRRWRSISWRGRKSSIVVSAATGATKQRLVDRHRRRHRDVLRLRVARPARVSRTRRSTSMAPTGGAVARAARSSGATSACRSKASPCTSTPSTFPCGECSRSSRRRCSPGCRRS